MPVRRRISVVTLLVALVAAALGHAVTGAGAATSGSLVGRVGMASHMFWMNETDARTNYAPLAQNGVTWVREDFRWDVLEPTKGSFNWTQSDGVMAAAASTGLNVLAILTYSSKWASSDPSGAGDIYYPPKSDTDYAAFARAVVQRYAAGGAFWASRPDLPVRPLAGVELWNEPWGYWNWKSGPDPVRYAHMARAAADAVKAAVPTMKVLLSGDLLQVRTDGAIVSWLDNVLATDPGLAGVIDAYSVHPYPYPFTQSPLVDHADRRWDYSRVTLIHDVAVNRNADKPLWLTEIGWSTANTSDSVSESTQAQYLHDAISRAFTDWSFVERLFAYTWTKDGTNTTDREAHYGVRRADGTYKPSWSAITSLLATTTTSSTTSSTTAAPTATSTTAAPTTTTTAPTTTTTAPTTTTTAAPTTTTTVAPSATQSTINLSASALKSRAKTTVSLVWSGASGSSVQLRRDGSVFATTANDGSGIDMLSKSALGTRQYTVCETVSSTCSPAVAVVVG